MCNANPSVSYLLLAAVRNLLKGMRVCWFESSRRLSMARNAGYLFGYGRMKRIDERKTNSILGREEVSQA